MPATMSIFLNVTDMTRALKFYEALGFRVDKTYKGDKVDVAYADLSYDGAELGLGNIQANDDPEFRAWVGTPLGAGVIVSLAVSDVDTVHERAKQAGAVIEHPPVDRPYGRVMTLNDPDGYSISFIREPTPA